METNENSINTNDVEYRLGFRRYKYIRERVENILNKAYKRRVPQYVVMIALLDAVEDEYDDSDISSHIEKLKELL